MIAGWNLDEGRHRIERGNESIRLEPKTTQLLGYLARHSGESLSRAGLLEEIWPGVIVGDEALTNAVNKIRKAFGDDRHNPQIIETIPKMGYRLIAPVSHEIDESRNQEEVIQGQPEIVPPGGPVAQDQPAPQSRFATWLGLFLVLAIGSIAGVLLLVQGSGQQIAGSDPVPPDEPTA